MTEVDFEEIKKMEYVTVDRLDGRTFMLMPFWDGKEWHAWFPINGKLQKIAIVDVHRSNYVGKQENPLGRASGHVPARQHKTTLLSHHQWGRWSLRRFHGAADRRGKIAFPRSGKIAQLLCGRSNRAANCCLAGYRPPHCKKTTD